MACWAATPFTHTSWSTLSGLPTSGLHGLLGGYSSSPQQSGPGSGPLDASSLLQALLMVANVLEPFKQALGSFPATSGGSDSNSDSGSGLSSSGGGGSGNSGTSSAAHSIATLLSGLGDMGLVPQLRVRSSDGKNAASSSSDPLAGAGAKSSSDGKDPTSSSNPMAGAGTTSPSAPNGDGSGAGTASSGSAAVSSMTQSGAQLAANGRSGWASSAVAADPAGGGGGSRSTIRLRAEGTSAPGGRRRLHASSAQQQQQQQQQQEGGPSASSAQVSSVLSQLLSTVMPQLLGSGSHGGGLGGLVIPPMSFSVTSGTSQLAEQGGPTAAAGLQQQGDPTAAAGQQPQADHGFIGSSTRPFNTNLFAIAPGSKALDGAASRGGLLAGRLGAALGGIGGGGAGGAPPTVTSFSVTGGTTEVTPADKASQPGDGSSGSGSTMQQQQEAVHPANANTNPITLPGNAAAGGGGLFGALLREALLGEGGSSSAGGLGSHLGGLGGTCCRCSS